MFVFSTLQTPQLSEEEMRNRGVFLLPVPRDIAPFELSSKNGETFENNNLKGVWSFVYFGFTHCPDICPTTMSVLGQVERQLQQQQHEDADRFRGVLVTVDPERDTLEKLNQYVTAFSPRFVGARGSREMTAQFAQQVNVAFAKVPSQDSADGYTMDHTGNIVIINPKGHYHGFIKLPHEAETIRLTFQTLAASF